MSPHTPGPWRINGGAIEGRFIGSGRRQPIAWVHAADTASADARLIAAAPDLLAACEAALALIATQHGGTTERAALVTAIAKAKGGTS